jgi:hypothetical protein
MEPLAFAIVGHLVGDYLLQNDYMALGKKRSTPICSLHCLIWSLSVVVAAGWWMWWVFPVLFITHFAQDRTNLVAWKMRVMGQQKFAQPPMAPWSMIAVDNSMHMLVLALVARCLG